SGMHNSDDDPRLFSCWIHTVQTLAGRRKKLHAANRGQRNHYAVHAIAHIRWQACGARHIAREMSVRSAGTCLFSPPAEPAILLIAFDLTVGSNDFVALVDGAFKGSGCYPIVVKMHAQAVIEIDTHLDRIVSVDPFAHQAFFLPDGSERNGFGS